jgi:hypothetical protein
MAVLLWGSKSSCTICTFRFFTPSCLALTALATVSSRLGLNDKEKMIKILLGSNPIQEVLEKGLPVG